MPRYTFTLRDGSLGIEDRTGVDLNDAQGAFDYAISVAREVMRGCEAEAHAWRLDVYEDDAGPIFELPFAAIDQSLDHLVPELRQMIVDFGERRRLLMETVHAARATVLETRALVAQSRGKPYLASFLGKRTISGGRASSS
ncbi:MAG TPA: hypothetical protein VKW08_23040 [Xanthobacteraceae bacterium]|nr:hypothetical protein [Xanthobacteraceae bacterium]